MQPTESKPFVQTPILVGIGMVMQREDDARKAVEPLALMEQAVRQAGDDCGAPALLAEVERIAVPKGRWQYADPAGAIASAIGAEGATTLLATVGVLQQTLIGDACRRIAEGEVGAALVVGGDSGYRILRARIAGERAPESQQTSEPDVVLSPHEELRHPAELRAGMKMPVGLYAIMESAYRKEQGLSVDEHRDRIAALYSRFSEIAEDNPHAWRRQRLDAAAIRNASDRNPMQAFPYTKLHCSSWNVDQASALLFCSVEKARALGIAASRWIYPLASTESNHMVPVSARAEPQRCAGARIAGRAALDAADTCADALDWVELYSCFPLAVETYATEIGLSPGRDVTVTGGMPFAGGPYNNYQLHATCRMVQKLREGGSSAPGRPTIAALEPRRGLVSCVSGVLTKQGFGLWSTAPGPNGFVHCDCSDEVARLMPTRPVLEAATGPGRIVGCTVLHDGAAPQVVVLVDVDGGRTVAVSGDPVLAARFEREEMVGAAVHIHEPGRFRMSTRQDELPQVRTGATS